MIFFSCLRQIENLCFISKLLFDFSLQAGQKVNSHKSQLLFSKGTEPHQRQLVSSIFQGPNLFSNFTYLGSSLGLFKPTKASWVRVTDKTQWKVTSWKGPLGRTFEIFLFINSNLLVSLLTFAKEIQSSLQSFCSKFLWKGSINHSHVFTPIAWSQVTLPIFHGGLGLRNLSVNASA